jgi:hypothetical protein
MHFLQTNEWPITRDAEGGGLGGGGGPDNGQGSDGAAGGFADAGAASASYDGSVSANAADYGNAGTFDFGPGGFATTGADVATATAGVALGVLGGTGVTGVLGAGLSVGAGVIGSYGSSPTTAAIDLTHDMSLGLGIAVTSNPSISMFSSSATDASAAGDPSAGGGGSFDWAQYWLNGGPGIYAGSSGGSEGGGVG